VAAAAVRCPAVFEECEVEAALASGAVGAGMQVRAGQNQRIRSAGLWDCLPPGAGKLLAFAEGSWTEAQRSGALLYLEAVEVLKWAVREDCDLPALRATQTGDREMLESVLAEQDPARETSFLRSLVELDCQEGPTRVYLSRLTSELVRRGASAGDRDMPRMWARRTSWPTICPLGGY
jgi:hypothetical protein